MGFFGYPLCGAGQNPVAKGFLRDFRGALTNRILRQHFSWRLLSGNAAAILAAKTALKAHSNCKAYTCKCRTCAPEDKPAPEPALCNKQVRHFCRMCFFHFSRYLGIVNIAQLRQVFRVADHSSRCCLATSSFCGRHPQPSLAATRSRYTVTQDHDSACNTWFTCRPSLNHAQESFQLLLHAYSDRANTCGYIAWHGPDTSKLPSVLSQLYTRRSIDVRAYKPLPCSISRFLLVLLRRTA